MSKAEAMQALVPMYQDMLAGKHGAMRELMFLLHWYTADLGEVINLASTEDAAAIEGKDEVDVLDYVRDKHAQIVIDNFDKNVESLTTKLHEQDPVANTSWKNSKSPFAEQLVGFCNELAIARTAKEVGKNVPKIPTEPFTKPTHDKIYDALKADFSRDEMVKVATRAANRLNATKSIEGFIGYAVKNASVPEEIDYNMNRAQAARAARLPKPPAPNRPASGPKEYMPRALNLEYDA